CGGAVSISTELCASAGPAMPRPTATTAARLTIRFILRSWQTDHEGAREKPAAEKSTSAATSRQFHDRLAGGGHLTALIDGTKRKGSAARRRVGRRDRPVAPRHVPDQVARVHDFSRRCVVVATDRCHSTRKWCLSFRRNKQRTADRDPGERHQRRTHKTPSFSGLHSTC